ncbi:MAG: HK97 gp10 family phage protein [Candidatus Bathyarchaeia archaeon]
MITVKVERSGLDIHVFAENIDRRLIQPLIERLADRAEQLMRGKAPVRTGTLRASITKRVGDKEAEVGPTVPYAVYVEFGARPHEIQPVHARALRFEAAGRVVFAMRVQHPGTRPQPFIRETVDQVLTEIPGIYEQLFKEAVEE